MLKLKEFWYIAAAASELGVRPIRRSVEGEPLALFRDEAGRAHALEDRCLHRGMALSAGRVADGCLQCPYHGWRYDGAGALAEVPALCEGERLPRARVRSFPVVEQDGSLWVWLGDRAPLADPFRFPHCSEPGWSSFFMHTRFEAPVEACLENFLDVPHTIFVHPGLFRRGATKPTRVRVHERAEGALAEFVDEGELQGVGPRLLFPRGTEMRHTDQFILPSISRVDYLFGETLGGDEAQGFVITSQCTQREEFVVDVTTAITWKLSRLRWAGPLVTAFLRWYCRRVIQQDVRMLAIQGRQWREFGRTAWHTQADLLGQSIARLRRQAVEAVSSGQIEAPRTANVRESFLRI